MQLSELSFIGIIQLIILLAEIAFFLFLLSRFRAWHIRVLEAKQGAASSQKTKDLDSYSSFDKEKAEDLLESGLTGIELEKARDSSDEDFLNRQETLLNNLAKVLDLKPASGTRGGGFIMPSASGTEQASDFDDSFAEDLDTDFTENLDEGFDAAEPSGFEDLSDDFSSSDFGLDDDHEGFESAEDMTDEGFDSFDDFDQIDADGAPKTDEQEEVDSWAKLDEVEPAPARDEGSVVQKASAFVEEEYNKDLDATLDDLEEFDFSELERELMKD